MSLSRIFSFLTALGVLLSAAPVRAQAIDATFDLQNLRAVYALACADQEKMRARNIPPPHFAGRPQAFANPDNQLVIYSPDFTAQQRDLAGKLFASVPPYALTMAYRGGAVYVFTRRSIVEAVPGLAVEDSWFSDYGLYMAVEKRLYMPFEKGVNITRQRDGTYSARHYIPSQREPFRIVNHETGHLIDDLLGAYSRDSTGTDGQSRLSNRADYQEALRHDFGDLLKRNMSAAQLQRLGYYLPYEYEGMILGGMQKSEQRARREIFAELWAETHGYDSNGLSRVYPRTFRLVGKMAALLKKEHERAPHHCP